MRPLLLKGHERTITHVQFNAEGDLLFSCSKSPTPCVWFADNGELAGTFNGHTGAVWSCDVSYDSKTLITGSADNTTKIWDVRNGEILHNLKHKAPVRSVGWGLSASRFFTATDSFMSFVPKISIFAYSPDSQKELKPLLEISADSKVSQAFWGRLDQTIYTCDDQGSITVYDSETGKILQSKSVHRSAIHKMSFDNEKGMFVTASKDGTAKLIDAKSLEILKTYQTGRPVNCAVISPLKYHVVLGGGESAETVTTSKLDTQQFRARFYHTVYENEIGSFMGHFGTMTCLAISPDGKSFASGAEDAYVRLHHLDDEYLNMNDK